MTETATTIAPPADWRELGRTEYLNAKHMPDRTCRIYPTQDRFTPEDEREFLAGTAPRNYYRGLPPLQRSQQQIMDDLTRTEPKGGAALIVLRWLTQDAARLDRGITCLTH